MTAHWRHKCHIRRLDATLEETEPIRELGLLRREPHVISLVYHLYSLCYYYDMCGSRLLGLLRREPHVISLVYHLYSLCYYYAMCGSRSVYLWNSV